MVGENGSVRLVREPQADRPALLERDPELAQLESALETPRARDVGAVELIEGPAGIGKTALLDAAEVMAAEHGLDVLTARGAELESKFGGGLARQLFEPVVMGMSAEERAELLSGPAELAGRLVGAVPAEERAEPGLAVLHGLYWLTANLAERQPLALLIDDIHWGDEVSLRFLLYLAHRIETVPVALIAAARSGEPGSAADHVRELATEQGVGLLRPAPLSAQAVIDVVAAAVGQPSPEFAAACQTASAGSPFLLQELLRAAAADGIEPNAGGALAVERLVPASVSHAILLRLGRVQPAARDLAGAAAVLGPGAELAHVAELAGLEPSAAADAFDALVAMALFADRRPLDFVHPLVRSAVYSDLPPSERSLLHSRAALIMRRAGATPDRLAVHLLALPPAGDSEIAEALIEAARAAVARGSADTAIAYLRRALEEPPPDDARHAVLLELGTTESRVGDPRAVDDLREAQVSAPDDDALIAATLALGLTLFFEGRMGDAVAAMQPVIDELAEKNHPGVLLLEGRLLAGAILNHLGAPIVGARIEAARERAYAAERPPYTILCVLSEWDAALGEQPAERIAARAERAIVERSPDDPTVNVPGDFHAYIALIHCERYALALRLIEERIDEGRRLGSLPLLTAMSTFAACAALRQGDLVAAEEHARTAVDTDAMHTLPLLTPFAAAMLAGTLIERDDLDEADAALRAGTPEPGMEPLITYPRLLGVRGRLRLAQGRFEEALESSLACGAELDRHRQPGPAMHPWRSDAALALHALGRSDEAAEMVRNELQRAQVFGAPRATGIALRTLGMLEGGDEGLQLLAEAVRVLESSEARLEHADALYEFGAAHRRANRRAEARAPLREALDLAARAGALGLRHRAEEELKATGARPRRLMLSGLDSLTASERRVARLAAEGRTNREIAQSLFVSARTVEGHLTSVYRKLDLSSRDELPAALAAGLAPG
ncbi:MAG: hypothetical protein QOI31_1284 [Solirubrobacterales bacterium]|nr:hypothetical protein [Solirubrobacterales bacterium]